MGSTSDIDGPLDTPFDKGSVGVGGSSREENISYPLLPVTRAADADVENVQVAS